MSLSQIEERLLALEQTVKSLLARVPPLNGPSAVKDTANTSETQSPSLENAIPANTEYPVFLSAPSGNGIPVKGIIEWVEKEKPGLALSEGDWANIRLLLEEEHA